MSGLFSNETFTLNALETKRKDVSSRRKLIDLTMTNPTEVGFRFFPELLAEVAQRYFRDRVYQPDAHGLLAAREAICEYYNAIEPAMDVTPDQIFLTASTSEAYVLVFSILAIPGDVVSAPALGYPLIEYLAKTQNLRVNPYGIVESPSGTWTFEEKCFDDPAPGTRAIVIITPHNPTGMTVTGRIQGLEKSTLPLIVDEVFRDFCFEATPPPLLGHIHSDRPVFHLNGISKMFALPDLKLGWIMLNREAQKRFGAQLELLNDTFLSANQLSQTLLPTLMQNRTAFQNPMKAALKTALKEMTSRLEEGLGSSVRCFLPQGGWMLFPRFTGRCEIWDDEELALRLLDEGVYAHPGYLYGEDESCRLVLSALTPASDRKTGIDALLRVLSN